MRGRLLEIIDPGVLPTGGLARMSGRLLLLSYHFGPGCDTGGFRWNAMTAHLAEAGWEVEVISAARPGRDRPYEFVPGVRVTPVQAPTWLGDVVEAVGRVKRRVVGDGAPPPPTRESRDSGPQGVDLSGASRAGLGQRLYTMLMGNVDAASRWNAELGWARRAARAGLAVSRSRMPSVVAVSSPPHPTHLAGVRVSRTLGVPYLADFRDPWVFGELDAVQSTLIDLQGGAWAQRRTFGAASLAVFNTTWATQAAVRHDTSLVNRSATVPNGYDPRSGIGLPDPDLFRVAFVGWLYDFMDPEPLLAACARLRDRAGLHQLRVEFVGTDSAPGGVSLLSRARVHGLESSFEHRRRVPREEALARQERAAVQVVFDYPGPLRVPMKFYDATQNYGDLLLVGRSKSALADAAAQLGYTVCPPEDSAAMDAALDRAVARWRARDYPRPVDLNGVFARRKTSSQMMDLLEGLGDSRLLAEAAKSSG